MTYERILGRVLGSGSNGTSAIRGLKHLVKPFTVYTFATAISTAAPLLLLPIQTRFMSSQEIGEFAVFQSLLAFLLPLICFDSDSFALVQFSLLPEDQFGNLVRSSIRLNLLAFALMGSITAIFAHWIEQLFGLPWQYVLLLPVAALLTTLYRMCVAVIRARKELRRYLVLQSVMAIATFLAPALLLVVFRLGLVGRVSGLIAGLAFTGAFVASQFKKRGYLFPLRKGYERQLLKYGVALLPHVYGGFLLVNADKLSISRFVGTSALSLYANAVQISAILTLFFSSVNQAWAPHLFNLLAEKTPESRRAIRLETFGIFALFCVTFAVFNLCAPLLVRVVLGQKYIGSLQYVPWISAGNLMNGLYFLFGNHFFFHRKTGALSMITITCGTLSLALNVFLVPRFGVQASAINYFITWTMFMLVAFGIGKMRFKTH